MDLSLEPRTFGIVRLEPSEQVPDWAQGGSSFLSVTHTADELSIVCAESSIPESVSGSKGWACLKVVGPLDLSAVGILADLAACLRRGDVPIFVVSTFETDYILVPGQDLERATALLREADHRVS